MVLLMTIAAVIVVVGTVAPVLHDVIGGRSAAVGGEFFARTVGPLALVALPFLVLQLRRRRRLPRSGYGWSSMAHAGVLVLLAGVGVSTFDDVATFGLGNGDERSAAGVDVRNDGVTVGDGPRLGTEAVTAALIVDGHDMRPRIVVYPDRGGRLAEVAVHTGPLYRRPRDAGDRQRQRVDRRDGAPPPRHVAGVARGGAGHGGDARRVLAPRPYG